MAKQIKTMKNAAFNQTFSLTAPGASRVLLVGDFTHWENQPINLHQQAWGLWQVAVALEPGEYRYRFLVDSEWHDDPDCVLRVPNPFGGEDALRKVPSTPAC